MASARHTLTTAPNCAISPVLTVMTTYLATANLLTRCKALVQMKAVGVGLNATYLGNSALDGARLQA